MAAKAGWYPNPNDDEAALAKGKYRYWDGSAWLPRYADVPPSAPVGKPQPKVLAETSADMYMGGGWHDARRNRSMRGHLLVVDENNRRRLEFVSDSGFRPPAILGTAIDRIVKAKSGINTVVEVHYHGDLAHFAAKMGHEALDVVCFLGPRGRMKIACAAIGHPI